jgi:hypothetical protein
LERKSRRKTNPALFVRSYPDIVIWCASRDAPDKKLWGIVLDAKNYESKTNELGEESIRKILEDQELRRNKLLVPVYGLLVVSQTTNHSKVYDSLKFEGKCPQLDLLKLEEGEILKDMWVDV